jgi:hypothetical protein
MKGGPERFGLRAAVRPAALRHRPLRLDFFAATRAVHYGARMSDPPGPFALVGSRAPELALPSSNGEIFRLHQRLEHGPVVLFFFIHNGTPG